MTKLFVFLSTIGTVFATCNYHAKNHGTAFAMLIRRKSLQHKHLRQILRRKFVISPLAVRVYVELFSILYRRTAIVYKLSYESLLFCLERFDKRPAFIERDMSSDYHTTIPHFIPITGTIRSIPIDRFHYFAFC